MTTTTVKFYLVDNAGNESPVVTQQIKIDTVVPYAAPSIVNVHGAYVAPFNPEAGESGTIYYRGVEAGSFQILMTPLPLGGSPVVSAGFSALPAEAVGFSFLSSAVTTPDRRSVRLQPDELGRPVRRPPTRERSAMTDEAGNTIGGPGSINNDSTPPTGGSVEASGLIGTGGRYSTARPSTSTSPRAPTRARAWPTGPGPAMSRPS